ncbi:MAG: choice-of-anchor D domain-containing protein [Flavobacteriaceae bacterium]|nr:choice-of-anchor D domain-containing protein [Flavobacteriaceae bacterium]
MKKLLCTLVFTVFAIGLVQAQAEIEVSFGTEILTDGQTAITATDGTDFGTVTVDGTGGISQTNQFTVTNLGDATLVVNTPPLINDLGTGTSDWSITGTSFFILPSQSSTFDITFDPTVAGLQTVEIEILNTDADENPFTFVVGGTGELPDEPEIQVSFGTEILTDGQTAISGTDGTDFGTVTVDGAGGQSQTNQFTITNLGVASLVVNIPPNINDLGTGTSDWSITSPAFIILPSQSSTFDITFDPTVAGLQTVEIEILNTDTDENPFTFVVGGTGELPNEPEIQVSFGTEILIDGQTAISSSDGTNFGTVTVDGTGGQSQTNQFTITNLGVANLVVNVPPNINDLGTGTSDWSITSPSFIILPSQSSTFDITFDPTVTGLQTTEIEILNTDTDENPFTFVVGGTGEIPDEPEIEVSFGTEVLTDGQTAISGTDGTDFGTVTVDGAGGQSQTNQFTISNLGTADLIVNIPPNINDLGTGTSDWSITSPSFIILPSQSSTFDITFDPTVAGLQTVEIEIINTDADENPFTFVVGGTGELDEPEIDISTSGGSIASGGTADFGSVNVSSGNSDITFTITNTGTQDLNLTGTPVIAFSGANQGDYTLTQSPATVIAANGGTTTFTIQFDPSDLGTRTAQISIDNDDADENPYIINLTGEGEDSNLGSPLLITQYYEGLGPNDRWIEVKNVSSNQTFNGSFFLAQFTDTDGTIDGGITGNNPNEDVEIPALLPGEVVLFRRLGASTINLGTDAIAIIDTEVCNFTGDDIIVISTTNDTNTYNSRIDIMGTVGQNSPIVWGQDTSLIKGCGTTESPSSVYDPVNNAYDPNQFLTLTLNEVDTADINTNIALGRQTVGSTIYTSSWSNGIPDKTKDAIVSGTYQASAGSFDACNLTVSGTLNLDGGTTNYVDVNEDLTITGSFVIGDTESLLTSGDPNEISISGVITKLENSTPLNDFNDFTYWSSPVLNANISTVFTGVDPNRIFEWRNPEPGDPGGWDVASGTMTRARGYISEAPSGSTQHNIAFTGTPNNGTVGRTVGYDNLFSGGYGFNLVGNPYPSAIDIDQFILLEVNEEINNNTMDGTIWLWTHNTAYVDNPGIDDDFTVDDYATYNLTGGVGSGSPSASGSATPDYNIGSGQGFFINVVQSGSVSFTNDMRLSNENDQFFRGSAQKKSTNVEKDRIWLNINSKEGGASNQLLIGFFDKATDGVDRGFDGLKLNGGNYISFYSKIGEDKYAIQGLGSYNADRQITLGLDAYITQTFTISIFQVEGVLKNEEIYLVDTELGIVHDLKAADYEFEITETGNYEDRFTLQFNKSVLSIDDEALNNDFLVINENSTLRLRSNSALTNVKVYDLLGRTLIDTKPNLTDYTLETDNIAKGTVLIINAILENGAEVSKKAIKY